MLWIHRSPTTRFFTSDQRAQLAALFDAIIPGDENAPGASDADAVEYVHRLLEMGDGTYYEISSWRTLYAKALPLLDAAASAALGGRGLSKCTRDEVAQLLRQLSQGGLQPFAADVDQKRLFTLLRNHCIEGCMADPRWGGNKGAVMWEWFGYLQPAQEFRRRRDVEATPAALSMATDPIRSPGALPGVLTSEAFHPSVGLDPSGRTSMPPESR